MPLPRTYRLLQIVVAIGALVPVAAGLAGIFMGPDMIAGSGTAGVSLDSHFRYLSGILLGVGLGFWSTIPDIGKKTARFRLLTGLVFVGGLGRLYALILMGAPDQSMYFGLIMEVGVTPLLALWQGRIADRRVS